MWFGFELPSQVKRKSHIWQRLRSTFGFNNSILLLSMVLHNLLKMLLSRVNKICILHLHFFSERSFQYWKINSYFQVIKSSTSQTFFFRFHPLWLCAEFVFPYLYSDCGAPGWLRFYRGKNVILWTSCDLLI